MKATLCTLALCALTVAAQAQSAPKKAPARPAPKAAPRPAPTKPAPRPASTPTPAPAPIPRPAPTPRSTAASASSGPFQVGSNALNLGIGLGNRYSYGVGLLGGSSSVTPALSLSYERGFREVGPGVVGLGGFVGYQGASYGSNGYKWTYTDLIVTLRGTFHYPLSPQFDAYGGLGLGLRRLSSSFDGPSGSMYYTLDGSGSDSYLASGLFVGGRYFFTENIGAFGELGYDQTWLKVGLSAKF